MLSRVGLGRVECRVGFVESSVEYSVVEVEDGALGDSVSLAGLSEEFALVKRLTLW